MENLSSGNINKFYFLQGGDEMGEMIRNKDWERTPLGNPENWPESLKISVSIMLNNPFGMYIAWGPEFIQLYNDGYRPILGETKHPQALGISTTETFSEIWNIIGPMFQDVMKGKPVGFPGLMLPLNRNGYLEECYFDFAYSPIIESVTGQVGGVLVTVVETTNNVNLIKSLKVSEQRFQKLVEQSSVGIIVLRGEDMIVDIVNNTYGRLIDRTTEELLGKPLFSVIPETEKDFRPLFDNIRRTGEPLYLNNHPYFYNSGNIKMEGFLNLVYQPYREKNDIITGVMVVCHDVTESVLFAKRIEESEEKFRTLADNIPLLTWMADSEGGIFWYNKQWYNYTGTTEKEMEGWGWKSVHDPDELPGVIEKWTTSINSGIPFEMVFPLKGHDNIYRPFLTRVVPIFDENGKIQTWFGTNVDVSDLKKSEALLSEKNKELQKINSDLDSFVYTASHDLKSPISNLEGLVNVLSELISEKCNDEEEQIFNMIHTSIDRFKTTILDLTEISRIQKGFEDDLNDLGFEEILFEVKNDLTNLITNAKAIIISDFKIENIFFSTRSLKSIVYNLISNALKYKDPGRNAIVKITTEMLGDYMLLSVEDNGLGINPDKKDTVFSMFKRLHSHVEGSGVGLYIVKRIIENNGGKIEIESELGVGTTFKLYFKNK